MHLYFWGRPARVNSSTLVMHKELRKLPHYLLFNNSELKRLARHFLTFFFRLMNAVARFARKFPREFDGAGVVELTRRRALRDVLIGNHDAETALTRRNPIVAVMIDVELMRKKRVNL